MTQMKEITLMERLNSTSYDIRKAAFAVNNNLGPGLLESVYERALEIELKDLGYSVKRQVVVGVVYNGENLGKGFRMDLVINNFAVIEVKSVVQLIPLHKYQLLTYLKISGLPLGLLINFNTPTLKQNIIRLINTKNEVK